MFRSWKVQHGMGEAIVAGIGRDVRARHELGPSIQEMQVSASARELATEFIQARYSQQNGQAPYDIEIESLRGKQLVTGQREMEAAVAIHRLIAQARKLEARSYLGNDHNWRFRMEVLKSGVVEWKRMGAAGGGDEPKDSRLLEEGEVIHGLSGVVGSIASAPAVGGELVMDFPGRTRGLQIRQGIHITGLVSPATGEEQVGLQILEKS